MNKVNISSYTDIGDVKTTNQDCILTKADEINGHNASMCIVADGCGGLAYGEEISNLVVTHFLKVWDMDLRSILLQENVVDKDIDELLEKEIREINETAKAFGEQVSSKVGSTLSLLLIIDGRYYIKNIGDSRIYLIRGKKIIQLTEDQSLVADMIRNGELTKKEAKTFKKKNVLTMCIGVFEEIRTYSKVGKVKPNDAFLLCCDGLHNQVSEKDMVKIVKSNKIHFNEKAYELRAKIEEGKANDNVSAVICLLEGKETSISKKIAVIALIVMLLAFVLFYSEIRVWIGNIVNVIAKGWR